MLGQQGRELVFRARAAGGGPDYMVPVGRLAGREAGHVIISCSTSSVACYINGQPSVSVDDIHGGNWRPGWLVFGNELRPEYSPDIQGDPASWKGLIRNVAVYSRWIGPEEARKKYGALSEGMQEQKHIQAVQVKAALVAAPAVPAPESIAPYRRALAVEHYKVEKAGGKFTAGEFLAARWVIMDGQVLKSAARREGETYALLLEPFADHPELEGERQVFAADRFDLPLYYEVGD